MSDKDSTKPDNSIKRGASILLKGGRMLSKSCPYCSSPLFEIDGKVICVNCEKEFVLVNSKRELKEITERDVQLPNDEQMIKKEASTISKQLDSKLGVTNNPVLKVTSSVIKSKLGQLNSLLEHEIDPRKIKELAEAIKYLVEALKLI